MANNGVFLYGIIDLLIVGGRGCRVFFFFSRENVCVFCRNEVCSILFSFFSEVDFLEVHKDRLFLMTL